MPTLPFPSITNLSVVPSAVEEAMEKRPLDTSYPTVHAPADAPPVNESAAFVLEKISSLLLGVVVPMPTLPVFAMGKIVVVAVPAVVDEMVKSAWPAVSPTELAMENFAHGVVVPMPTLPLLSFLLLRPGGFASFLKEH